jgi:hypothetical protein
LHAPQHADHLVGQGIGQLLVDPAAREFRCRSIVFT